MISIKQVLSFVISITLTRVNLEQNNLMGHRGVRYAIQIGSKESNGAWLFIPQAKGCWKRGSFSGEESRNYSSLNDQCLAEKAIELKEIVH